MGGVRCLGESAAGWGGSHMFLGSQAGSSLAYPWHGPVALSVPQMRGCR